MRIDQLFVLLVLIICGCFLLCFGVAVHICAKLVSFVIDALFFVQKNVVERGMARVAELVKKHG